MKIPSHLPTNHKRQSSGAFTLMETVIAIGVLAVLLTGFIAVFTPAAQGIRRSISSEQADRLTTTLEIELTTLRTAPAPNLATGFDKAFNWIKGSNVPANAIFVYQYRGDPAVTRPDGTPAPKSDITGKPGVNYIVQSMARLLSDAELTNDLKAIEGSVFFVKPTQLVFSGGELKPNPAGVGMISNPSPLPVRVPPYPVNPEKSDDYAEAVIAFSAEFHSVPTKSLSYLNSDGFKDPTNGKFYKSKPIFTRNLAVRR